MATKLRNFNTSMITKVMAMVLFAVCMALFITQIMYLNYKNYNAECLVVKEYKNSASFAGLVTNAMYTTNDLLLGTGTITITDKVYYYYYATDGKKTYSNTKHMDKSFYQKYDRGFYCFENGVWLYGKNTKQLTNVPYYQTNSIKAIYIAFPDQFLDTQQSEWQSHRDEMMPVVVRLSAVFLLGILLVVFLIWTTGRRPQDRELHMSAIDKVYSDVLLSSFILFVLSWFFCLDDIMRNVYYNNGEIGAEQIFSMVFTGVFTAVVSIACGIVVLSIVRKIKAGKFVKHSLVYSICYYCYDFTKSLYDGRRFERYPLTKSLFYKQMAFISSSAGLVFFTFVFWIGGTSMIILPPALEIVIIYWYITGNNKTFAQINKGFNESLEDQMKAERMKIALVTNVSHDLKTPLTSIISYIDLLSKEENLSEEASDYIRILEEKSNRLKTIVADLFDLAKSTSGDISLDMESLDIKKLIEQTLADMEDKIEQSELQFKVRLPEKPIHIMADGKKLYRVFQNIIDNSLKYSLKGTRVYVELDEVDGRAVATVKNTASYEMDFTAYEILQRFNRGDKARSTEGSGLGLSIAESFTNVCGGNFKVEVDGDLFKVMLAFNVQ